MIVVADSEYLMVVAVYYKYNLMVHVPVLSPKPYGMLHREWSTLR